MLGKLGQRSFRTLMALAVTLPLTLAAPTMTAADDDRGISTFNLPGNSVFPEGVAVDDNTGKFYVSSAATGDIFVGDENTTQLSVFSPAGSDGRNSATGMKVDRQGRLFGSGAGLGKIYLYDTRNAALISSFEVGQTPSFVNDVALTRKGDAYFTDSLSPSIYRVSDQNGKPTFERWLDLVGSTIVYTTGFNLNGIAVSKDDKSLIVIQSNTGKLFKIDIAGKQVSEINTNGAVLTGGDGILLQERRLYVLRNSNQLLVTLELSDDLTSARVSAVNTSSKFQFPTTLARLDKRFLIVNSQFDKQGGQPILPFNVVAIPIPKRSNGTRQVATLSGAAEVNGGDSDGAGTAKIQLKIKDSQVCFELMVSSIRLPATLSHIHRGNAGSNGPVVIDFQSAPDANGQSKGCVTVDPALLNAIWSNPSGYYVNVHNADFPGGAVRGQLALSSNMSREQRESDEQDGA